MTKRAMRAHVIPAEAGIQSSLHFRPPPGRQHTPFAVISKFKQFVYVSVALSLHCAEAFAAEAERPFAAPQAAERVATPSAGSLAQVTLSLVLVLAAVFAAAWAVRRLKTFGKFGAGPIEIIADVSIGAKERAVLIEVGGRQLLLGVAPGRVSTLHVLEQPLTPEQLQSKPIPSLPAGGTIGQRPDFKSILKRSLGL